MKPTPQIYALQDSNSYFRNSDYAKSPLHRNRLACILDMVAASASSGHPTRVLDIGCGTGNISIPLAAVGYVVKGIDPHAGSIEATRRKNPYPNLELAAVQLESEDLARYDALVLTEVLEHVPDCRSMLARIAAGMARDAHLILTIPNGWSVLELASRPSYRLKRTAAGTRVVKAIKRLLGARDLTTADTQTPHLHFFTLRRICRMLDDAGFETVQFRCLFLFWPLWEIFFTRLISERAANLDFRCSQQLPAAWGNTWAFLLRRRAA